MMGVCLFAGFFLGLVYSFAVDRAVRRKYRAIAEASGGGLQDVPVCENNEIKRLRKQLEEIESYGVS